MNKITIEDVFAEAGLEDEKKPKKEEKKPKEQPKEEPKKEEQPKEPEKRPEPEKEPEPKQAAFSFEKIPKKKDDEFDLSATRALAKHVITIYGNKGDGKTTVGQFFGDSQVSISFDSKTEEVRRNSKFGDNILVFDGTRYLDKTSPEAWTESAERTWRYINKLLDRIPDIDAGKEESAPNLSIAEKGDMRDYASGNPDWFMVDAGEVFEQIAEMTMRYRNGLKAFEGFPNKNLWKERRMYLDQLVRKCLRKARKGLIWTSYVRQEEVIEKGEFVTKKDAPKWIDVVLLETDVVIRVERSSGKNGQVFYVTVESSKWTRIPETGKVDITNKGIEAIMK